MNTMNEEGQKQDSIEELLPWYAAGTLNRRDAQRVEDAFAKDPELVRRFELVREELASTIQLNETLGAPSVRAIDKLFARIDAEPARRTARSLNIATRISDFLASLSPNALLWSAGAAALVIMVQTGVIGSVMLNQQPGGYQTASAPENVSSEIFALIRFAPEATAGDIGTLLQANNVSITSGPMAGGLYRLSAQGAGHTKRELASIIPRLQQDKAVSFVAPTE